MLCVEHRRRQTERRAGAMGRKLTLGAHGCRPRCSHKGKFSCTLLLAQLAAAERSSTGTRLLWMPVGAACRRAAQARVRLEGLTAPGELGQHVRHRHCDCLSTAVRKFGCCASMPHNSLFGAAPASNVVYHCKPLQNVSDHSASMFGQHDSAPHPASAAVNLPPQMEMAGVKNKLTGSFGLHNCF